VTACFSHPYVKFQIFKKYETFVDSVAQTSMVLALLLPHILYVLAVISLKYVAPSFVRYLATKTFLTAVISVYHPILKTILLVHRWVGIAAAQKKERDDNKNATPSRKCGAEDKRSSIFSLFRKKNGITDKYLAAASQNSPQGANMIKVPVDGQRSVKISSSDCSSSSSSSDKDLTEEVIELLKYWSVYAFLTTTYLTLSLLPFIGRIFSNKSLADMAVSSRSRLSVLRKIRISRELTEEVKLVFFVWLNFLPTSTRSKCDGAPYETDGNIATTVVKNKALVLDKKVQASQRITVRKNVKSFTSQPLDIFYERLSPLAISLVQSSTTSLLQSSNILHQKDTDIIENGNDNSGSYTIQSLIMKAISGFRSILDVLVWSNIIAGKTKHKIIAILTECVDLLPALATLCMPSYFTSYGIIYVRLVVPAAKSVHVINALHKCTNNDDKKLKNDLIAAVVRYLKYWVIHFILHMFLTSFSPILDWIPLVTHMQWILWAYVHLESSTLHLYSIFSRDLMAFGLLNQHTNNEMNEQPELDINDTVVVKVLKSIFKRLPSGNMDDTKGIQSSDLSQNLNDTSTKVIGQSLARSDSDMSGLSAESELVLSENRTEEDIPCDVNSNSSGLSMESSVSDTSLAEMDEPDTVLAEDESDTTLAEEEVK